MKLKLVWAMAAWLALVCGCQTPAAAPPEDSVTGVVSVRNNACSLLYDLLNDERHLSKLLLIKRESRALNSLIKEIAQDTGNAAKRLQQFAAQDPSLNLEVLALPPGERATRQTIAKLKERQLLHQKGAEFEKTLLLTQVEALNYAAHLALVVAQNDSIPTRAQYFSSLSQALSELRERVLQLLFSHAPQTG
jgi:hypothetical protein